MIGAPLRTQVVVVDDVAWQRLRGTLAVGRMPRAADIGQTPAPGA
jgi:hypothetical protein